MTNTDFAAGQNSSIGMRTEQRDEVRYRVRWHVDVFAQGRMPYQGFIRDLSIKGGTLYLDCNPVKIHQLHLKIIVPPVEAHTPPHVIEVDCKVIYALHDSKELLFRAGVEFTAFQNSADQDFLSRRLLKHEIPVG